MRGGQDVSFPVVAIDRRFLGDGKLTVPPQPRKLTTTPDKLTRAPAQVASRYRR